MATNDFRDSAPVAPWPAGLLPGNSAPGGCLAVTVLAIVLPLLAFVTLQAGISLNASISGHLIWPFFQWAFMTEKGALTLSAIGGIALAPLFFFWLRGLIAQMLAYASDVTGETAFELPHHPPSQVPAIAPAGWRWALLYGLDAGGTTFLMSVLVWVENTFIVYPKLPPCDINCVPTYFDASGAFFMAPAIAFWLALLACFGWLHWLQYRCGIWLRKEPLVWRGFDYVRRPGITVESAATALAHYRATRIPSLRTSRLWGLVTVAAIVVWFSGVGQLLDASLPLLWRP